MMHKQDIIIVGIVIVVCFGGLGLLAALSVPTPPAVGSRLVDSVEVYAKSSMIYTGQIHSTCGGWRGDDVGTVSASDDDLTTIQAYYEKEMSDFCAIAQGFNESSFNCNVDPWIAIYAPPISGSICLASACYMKLAPQKHFSVTLLSDAYQSAKTTIVEDRSSSYPTGDTSDIPCGE